MKKYLIDIIDRLIGDIDYGDITTNNIKSKLEYLKSLIIDIFDE